MTITFGICDALELINALSLCIQERGKDFDALYECLNQIKREIEQFQSAEWNVSSFGWDGGKCYSFIELYISGEFVFL